MMKTILAVPLAGLLFFAPFANAEEIIHDAEASSSGDAPAPPGSPRHPAAIQPVFPRRASVGRAASDLVVAAAPITEAMPYTGGGESGQKNWDR